MRFCRLISAMRATASGGLLRTMSVSTVPGASAFTRIRCGAHSAAMLRVKAISAALAPAYIAVDGDQVIAPTETTLSTAGQGLLTRCGSADVARNTGPRRFTAYDFSQAPGVICAIG